MTQPLRSFWPRYGFAIGSFLIASAIRLGLAGVSGRRAPAAIYILAALFTAIVAGFGPSLLTLALGIFAALVLFRDAGGAESWLSIGIATGLNLAVGMAVVFYVETAAAGRRQLEREVSDRRRAEENERLQAERMRTTLASIGDAVVVADESGLVTALNPVAEALTGWPAAEAIGRPLKVVFRALDAETQGTADMPIAQVLRDGSAARDDGPTVMAARDGTTRPVETITTPLRDARGAIGGVVLVFRDITDRRRAEDQLAEQTRRAESLHRIGSRLAAELDLRTIICLVTEEAAAITRAEFGAFYYDDDQDDPCPDPIRRDPPGPLTFYAGAGRIPVDFPPRQASSAVSAAVRQEKVLRFDDIRGVPPAEGAGPGTGFLGSHPSVRSLLVVPIVSRSGPVLGVMLFGHPDASAFGPADERLTAGIAAQAAVAIDNARLFRAAQESEQRFRQLAENVSDVFWIYDTPGRRLLYVGPAYEVIWGRSRQSIYESMQTFFDSIHPADRGRVIVALEGRENGETTSDEYRIVRPDGAVRWVWDRAFPIRDGSGKVVRVAGIAEDVTERKVAEEALRESDRRKTEFIAMLAHELRNPLAPIRNALQLIKSRPPAPAESPFLDEHAMIERQVVHMTRLIDDLLDVTRISRGKIALRFQTVDVAEVARRAVSTTRPLTEAAGLELSVSVPDEPITVSADPTRLEQILGNLLNNAVKYTDPGGEISLTVRRDGASVAIVVRDTGIGIAADLLPRVFDWFVQGLQRPESAHVGLGIGLSLVHNLVKIHGGTISARSDGPGLGSKFVVRLPALADVPAPPEPPPIASAVDRPGRHRVLVVDDNRDAAESLDRLLTRVWGQEVRVAHDGPSALRVAGEFRPELVLLDIGLPGMSGYDVARDLRGRPEFETTRLVALTGWGQEEDRRKSSEAGFDRHLVKPIEPDTLGQLVTDLDAGVSP